MNHNVEFYRLCLAAFADTDWHVAMAIGDRTDPAELGEIPANLEVRPYFPQQAVLARANAFITHAGMNSVMESLWHQVPMVAVPQTPEQAANADRVEQLGAGQVLARPTVEELRQAVLAVTDPSVARSLGELRRSIDRAGGADAGVTALEHHLAKQPARSDA
jgi:MGT family glycosyltransferase